MLQENQEFFQLIKLDYMNYKDVYKSIVETGGASYNLATKVLNPSTGYMVSVPGFTCIVDKPKTEKEFHQHCADYLEHCFIRFAEKSNTYLGFWINGNELVIDISENISDRDEAIRLGKKREQLCIWDCANKCEIDTRQMMQMN